MQFRIEDSSAKNGATTLIATTSANSYTVTGLKPRTNYWFHVYAWNGIRDGAGSWLAVNTHGIRIRVPTVLTVGTTYTVTYLEYPLGSVPIGTEPSGFSVVGIVKRCQLKWLVSLTALAHSRFFHRLTNSLTTN